MTQFKNNPMMRDESGDGKIRRYVHQPITIEHYGIQAAVTENGRVKITGKPTPVKLGSDEVEYDEVDIPASLIFKLARLLKDTRTIKYVNVSEAANFPSTDEKD